jgi:hypothetical protein
MAKKLDIIINLLDETIERKTLKIARLEQSDLVTDRITREILKLNVGELSLIVADLREAREELLTKS